MIKYLHYIQARLIQYDNFYSDLPELLFEFTMVEYNRADGGAKFVLKGVGECEHLHLSACPEVT
jgi:hypothetical protein